MGCDCARTIPQWILSTVNFAILFVSLVALFLGLTFSFAPNQVLYLAKSFATQENIEVVTTLSHPLVVEEAGTLLIVISCLLLPPSLLGYMGALRVNSVLLLLYLVPVLLLWSSQLLFLTCLPLLKSRLTGLANWAAQLSIRSYRGETVEPNLATVGWNHIMSTFSCCGYNNFTDFEVSPMFSRTKLQHQAVPTSCCILDSVKYPVSITPQDSHCIFTPTRYNSYFLKGCFEEIGEILMSHLDIIVIAVICLLTLEVILVILSVCLCLLRKEGKSVHTVLIRDTGRMENGTRDEMRTKLVD